MFTSQQRYVVTKALLVKINQLCAMFIFFNRHGIEHTGTGRVVFSKPIGIGAINSSIIFLGRYSQCKNFLLGERIKASPG